MGKSCCIKGCTNRFSKGGKSFHRFPTLNEQKARWIQTIQGLNHRFDWQPSEYTWVCGDHFQTGKPSHFARDPDYIPNKNLICKPKEKKVKMKKEKKPKKDKKSKKQFKEEQPQSIAPPLYEVIAVGHVPAETPLVQTQPVQIQPTQLQVVQIEPVQMEPVQMDIEMSSADEDDTTCSDEESDDTNAATPETTSEQDLLTQLQNSEEERMILVAKLSLLSDIRREEKKRTKAQLQAAHSEILLLQEEKTVLLELRQRYEETNGPPRNDVMSDNFLDDTERCSYYTGLPCSDKVTWVLSLVFPGIESKSKLAPIKQLILILMKIKLDPPLEDIAFRFDTTINMANRIFDSWLPELGKKLGALVKWPNENELLNSMPTCFEYPRFRNSVIIIDLLELLTQQWYSRKDVLLKVLIAFAPNGTVIYLSQCYECEVSDFTPFRMEQEFLNHLKPGDVVFADRMFDSSEFTNVGAELICPPYYEGMHRIIEAGIIQERNMLEVTAHVKKVVNRFKMFRMLATGIMPHTSAEHASYIVRACAGLINLNPDIAE